MAHVDNLIERIADSHLRAQIAEEVAKLVERKDFGLVFQRHLPEDLEVPGTRPRRGDIVRLRADADKQNYVVLSARGGTASVIAVDAAKQTIEGSAPATHAFDELVVVKDFSMPVYPGFQVIGEINRGGDKPSHVVIQGENYYALETLLYTHERKIDLIYVDPPYNTGTDAWIYNDRFVASTDAYRNSKWLSFMERRLLHARRLLKDSGVIIAAIGDDEHHRLRMLMDQIFGPNNFLSDVVWQGGRKNDARYVSNGADYMLIYARDESVLAANGIRWRERKPGVDVALSKAREIWEAAGGEHGEATRQWRAWMRDFKLSGAASDAVTRFNTLDEQGRPIRTDGNLRSPNPRPNLQYDLPHPLTGKPVKMHPNGWVYAKDRMEELVREGRVVFGPDHTVTANLKRYLEDADTQAPLASFASERARSSRHLEHVLGGRFFPNPKDHEVLARWIGMIAPSDGIILDFFGGSGTTTEAVMQLNSEDAGRRQSILITNNELSATSSASLRAAGVLPGDPAWESEGVFEKVTRPRIEAISSGIRVDGSAYSDGMNENVAFLKLTYEDENLVALGRRFDAVAPLLWLKAGGVGPIVRRRGDALWTLPSGAAYGVLFAPAQAKAFAELIAAHERELRHLFVVTDSESEFQEAVAYLPPELRLETTRLYADYLHSFEINGKG